MNGILVINKPKEFTSFDVVSVVRKISGQRKIGHTGTLDPNATGVLPLLLGNATKAQNIIPNQDKEYVAKFRLGMTTDTLDKWGQVTFEKESNATKAEIENILPQFTGEISQIPPMYSAVQVDGQRLYNLARKGIHIERKSRKVIIYKLQLINFDAKTQQGKLFIRCSKGTYVRTIIDDMGKALSVGAVMTALKRISACGYKLSDSITLDEVKALAKQGQIESRLMPTETIFITYPYIVVSESQAKRFYNGGALDCARTYLEKINPPQDSIFRVKSPQGDFLGLGIVKGTELKVYKHI